MKASKLVFMFKMFHMICIAIQKQCEVLPLYTSNGKTMNLRYNLTTVNTLMGKASSVTS